MAPEYESVISSDPIDIEKASKCDMFSLGMLIIHSVYQFTPKEFKTFSESEL